MRFCENQLGTDFSMDIADEFAEALYIAGYRKNRDGKWIKSNNAKTCVVCHYTYYSNGDLFSYCPNCGSRMKGD